jgi:small subunit ribosomal protein S21
MLRVLKFTQTKKGVISLPKVIAKNGESFQVLLRRFKKSCERAGLLSDLKKIKYYEKPSVVRKKEKNEQVRKAMKRLRKQRRFS